MKTLVLGPDEVREALNPVLHPRRQVFLVNLDGDIFCCDLDDGWVRFKRPVGLQHRKWATAVKAAVDALSLQLETARAVHSDLVERTEPFGLSSSPNIIVRLD